MIVTTMGAIRKVIREALLREFGEPSGASGSDPTDAKGFYPYDIERGADIHGFWYKSPGRQVGEDGDPYRSSDAAAYIGMKKPEPETPEGEEGEGEGESAAPGEMGEEGSDVPGEESDDLDTEEQPEIDKE